MRGSYKLVPLFFLAPSLITIGILYFYPFALAVYMSLGGDEGELGLMYYRTAVELYSDDILFTLYTSALAAILSTLLAIVIASYLRMGSWEPIKRALNAIYKIPLFVPMVVVAQMMRSFLAPHGTLNLSLKSLGIIESPIEFFDWKGLVLGFLWKQTPFAALIILSGFVMVKDEHIEAARINGAGYWRTLLHVLIPMARTSIAIALVLTFASNVGTLTLPYMLIGGAKPTSITVDIAHRVTMYGDWGTANALGMISFLMVGIFAAIYLREAMRRGLYDR